MEHIGISPRLLSHGSIETIILTAKGTGMLPEISPNDTLFCVKGLTCKSGDIVILFNGKDFHCKYFLSSGVFINGNKDIFNSTGYKTFAKVTQILTTKL